MNRTHCSHLMDTIEAFEWRLSTYEWFTLWVLLKWRSADQIIAIIREYAARATVSNLSDFHKFNDFHNNVLASVALWMWQLAALSNALSIFSFLTWCTVMPGLMVHAFVFETTCGSRIWDSFLSTVCHKFSKMRGHYIITIREQQHIDGGTTNERHRKCRITHLRALAVFML